MRCGFAENRVTLPPVDVKELLDTASDDASSRSHRRSLEARDQVLGWPTYLRPQKQVVQASRLRFQLRLEASTTLVCDLPQTGFGLRLKPF